MCAQAEKRHLPLRNRTVIYDTGKGVRKDAFSADKKEFGWDRYDYRQKGKEMLSAQSGRSAGPDGRTTGLVCWKSIFLHLFAQKGQSCSRDGPCTPAVFPGADHADFLYGHLQTSDRTSAGSV